LWYIKEHLGNLEYLKYFGNMITNDWLLIAQDYEDLEYVTKKLIDEYELWGLKLNVKKN